VELVAVSDHEVFPSALVACGTGSRQREFLDMEAGVEGTNIGNGSVCWKVFLGDRTQDQGKLRREKMVVGGSALGKKVPEEGFEFRSLSGM
jgi:hypothetical protein